MPDPVADRATVRAAMIGLYYDSLGSEFEIHGAPSVLIPPDIQPVRRAAALEQLRPFPQPFREACWLLARSVRPFGPGRDPRETYPAALNIARTDWDELGKLRRKYRETANLFSATLVACRDDQTATFNALAGLLYGSRQDGQFSPEAEKVIGAASFGEILNKMLSNPEASLKNGSVEIDDADRLKIQGQIFGLEKDIGIGIDTIVDQFADAAAFTQFYPPSPEQMAAGGTAVLPVTSVVRQNVKSLLTVATVTTLVTGDFDALVFATNPENWHVHSDVFTTSNYIKGPYDFAPESGPAATGKDVGLLDEMVSFAWGDSQNQRGSFHNVLNVQRKVVERNEASASGKKPSITIKFSLCRSVDSTILWDRRLGGIEVDSGFIKVRHLHGDTWRVTYKKFLQFSDRTPNSYSSDWMDLGQTLNYFAPAALTWWLESETYSMSQYKSEAAGGQRAGSDQPDNQGENRRDG